MGNVMTACSGRHRLLSGWDPDFIPKCRELNLAASDEMKGISRKAAPATSQARAGPGAAQWQRPVPVTARGTGRRVCREGGCWG